MTDLALFRQALDIGRRPLERPKTPEEPTRLAVAQAEIILSNLEWFIKLAWDKYSLLVGY